MKIYRIAQISNLDELIEKAKRYETPEDFANAYSVEQNLNEYGIPINSDGTVTLYHATSPDIIQKINEEGFIKGGSTATGGMTGLALQPSAFFGWDKDWVKRIWGRSGEILEIKVPHQYIRQPAQNPYEIYFEGGLRRVDSSNNIWEPVQKPRDTFYNRLPAKDFNFLNDETNLVKIWEIAHEDI